MIIPNSAVNESQHPHQVPASVPLNTQPSTTPQQYPSPYYCKDFRISGQIGEPGQKVNLKFSSLAHQIENGHGINYRLFCNRDRRCCHQSHFNRLTAMQLPGGKTSPNHPHSQTYPHNFYKQLASEVQHSKRDPPKLSYASSEFKTESTFCILRVRIRS